MFIGLNVGTQYLVQKVIHFVMQLFVFLAIPFICYLLTKKKNHGGFLKYIGLTKASEKSYSSALGITGIAYLFTICYFIVLKFNGGMVISPLQQAYEISSPITFAFTSLLFGLNAGVCEEILFRGFIGKRLIQTLGFKWGNLIQAIIFVFPHFTTFGITPTFEVIVGVINAGVMGWTFGYIMHKKSKGSILPSIVVHTLVDIIAIPISLFLL